MLAWCVATGAALVSGALFLQTLNEGYLVAVGVATLTAGFAAAPEAIGRMRWPFATALVLLLFTVATATYHKRVALVDAEWDAVSARMQERGLQQIFDALELSETEVRSRASRALAAPADVGDAFQYIAALALPRPERSTILYRGDEQVWSGPFRADPEILPAVPVGVSFTEFFVVLHATAATPDGAARARALTLLQALPPADKLAASLERQIARNSGTAGFTFLPVDSSTADARPFV
jgi:hypothetical protein